jgi:ABC-type polysaccharide/polyol phosphate transport system ATPase subunit
VRDVSLRVSGGEALGLIGTNGSGKSTILKLIGAIMRPTRGRVQVSGSVSALIELGAGFHPEFSGRDNVYIYGALLGQRRADLRRKFDAIIAFAELEPFVDAPVKHYSSGMYMRLAFAVAAHVEPNILLVDEVLAVGDEAFQQKCLARIGELRAIGTTVVFVSHALDTVADLSDRVIWIDRGQIVGEGKPRAVVDAYRRAEGGEPSPTLPVP